MNTPRIVRSPLQNIIAALVCVAMPLPAQDDILPPAPPGMTNIPYWDGNSLRVLMQPIEGGGFENEVSGPPAPGGGNFVGGTNGTSPPVYNLAFGTNLGLFIASVPESNTVVITVTNIIAGYPYELLEATNLLGPWWPIQSMLATNPATNAVWIAQPIPIGTNEGMFFEAEQANPGTVRWAVPLVQSSSQYPAPGDEAGTGLDGSPSLSPDGTTIYMPTAYNTSNVLLSTLYATISAIDLMTGNVKWADSIYTPNDSNPQPGEMTGAAAVSPDGSTLYVGSCDGNLYSLNATNGATNWFVSMGAYTAVYSTPAIDGSGRILVATDETEGNRMNNPVTGVLCLTAGATHCTTNWFFQPQDPYYAEHGDVDGSLAVAPNGDIVFLAEGSRLYRISPSGHIRWFLPFPGHNEPDSSVAIDATGRIIVGSNSGYIYCVNADGSLEWVNNVVVTSDNGPIQCSPTVGPGNIIYSGTGLYEYALQGWVYALNPDGSTNWVFSPAWPIYIGGTISSPAIGETAVYFGSMDGKFRTLANGSVARTYATGGSIISSPLICPDGSVVFGSEDGYLYCLWGSSLPAGTNAAWPTFHQNPQRTGLAPATEAAAEDFGAPFLYDATNNAPGEFTFSIVGLSNTVWNVCRSSDLSNWTVIYTDLTLGVATGSTNQSGTNKFRDDSVGGVSQRFYQLSNSNGCSRAIGFVNLTVAPGTNLIANQLCQVDDGVLRCDYYYIPYSITYDWPMNTLNALFNVYAWDSNLGETVVLKWNGQGFDGATNQIIPGYPRYWSPGGVGTSGPQGGDITMLPGTSVIMVNKTGSPFTVSFAGLVREQQVFQLQPGTHFLSATAPIAGYITNVTGYQPQADDTVQLWNTNSNAFISHTFTSSGWSNGAPYLNIGEGFVLISGHTNIWTNSWQKTACASQ